MNIQTFCSKCGGQLIPQGENTYKCKFCDAMYREDTVKKEIDALSTILDESKREKVSGLKRELWKKANEENVDSQEVLRLCREIKLLVPDDFYANFYEAANGEIEEHFVTELECIDVIEHYDDMEHILTYALRSITPKNMLAICNLIERAYKQNDLSLYNDFRSKYDEECNKINDCVYDPAHPRDAFICYSSKDMAKVESLVKYLEDQGLLCFVAIRNLQHGRGAVQNYWNALHTAIESCKCIVFLSSTNSRDLHCDALQELRYVMSLEQKYNKKIKKIEYLLENYTGAPVERNFKKIFEGLEYCYDEETVFDRIMWDETEDTPVAVEPEINVQKEIKICQNCGKENPDNAKFCFNCGKDVFVATQEEFIEHLRKEREELEKQRQSFIEAQKEAEKREVERAEQAKRDAEQAKKDAEKREAEIAERARIEAEKAEQARREAERLEAERREKANSGNIPQPTKQAPKHQDNVPQPSKQVPKNNQNNNIPQPSHVVGGSKGGNNDYFSGGMQFEDIEIPKHNNNDYFSGGMQFVDVDTPKGRSKSDNNQFYTGSYTTELIKGQHVLLQEGIRKVRVTIQNEYKLDDVVADLYVFLLDGNERVLSESDLVFYGNPSSLNKSVVLNNKVTEDSVDISFNKINQDITKIRFILSINMDDGRVRNFSMLKNTAIKIMLEDQAYSFDMTDVGRFQSVSAIEFYRIRNKWKINIQAAGLRDDIASLCGTYGIDVG